MRGFLVRLGLLLVALLAAPVSAASSSSPPGLAGAPSRGLRHVGRPVLSPDGRSVAYVLDGREIWVAPAGGGPGRRLSWNGPRASELAWIPGSGHVGFIGPDARGIDQVWVLSVGPGEEAVQLTTEDLNVVEHAWSRDGNRIAFLYEERSQPSDRPLSSGRLAGKPVDLIFDGADLRGVLLLFSDVSGLSVVVDPDVTGTVHARFRQKPWDEAFDELVASHGLEYSLRGRVIRVGRRGALSAEGQAVFPRPRPIVVDGLSFKREGIGYLPDWKRKLVVLDGRAQASIVVPNLPLFARGLAWSPDGTQLAFAGAGTGNGRGAASSDVFVVGLRARSARCLTPSPVNEDSPSFTPDGTEVVYRVEAFPGDSQSVTHRVAAVNVATGRSRPLVSNLDREVKELQAAPDGRHAWFLLPDSGRVQLLRAGLDDGRVEVVVGGEREITEFDVGAGGRAVFVSSTIDHPSALFGVGPGGVLRGLVEPSAAFVRGLRLFPARRISASAAGGPRVEAFYLPALGSGPAGAPPPAVVWLHGGPYSQHTASFDPMWHVLSAAGFAVLLPNPRGSSGRGRDFGTSIQGAWGTHDVDDVMALVDEAVRQGLVDGRRLGIGGWSYGGFLTNRIVTRTARFKAAVSGAGLANMLADYGVSDTPGWVERELGLPWTTTGRYIAASPLFQVDRVRTPTLVLCGQDDMRAPLGQSEQWYQALKRVGVEAQLVIYPGEGHSPSAGAWDDVVERSVGWYTRWLRPAAGPE